MSLVTRSHNSIIQTVPCVTTATSSKPQRNISEATFPMDSADEWMSSVLEQDQSSVEEEKEEVPSMDAFPSNNNDSQSNDIHTNKDQTSQANHHELDRTALLLPEESSRQVPSDATSNPQVTAPKGFPNRGCLRKRTIQSIQDLYIKKNKNVWKTLPPPNLELLWKQTQQDTICTAATTTSYADNGSATPTTLSENANTASKATTITRREPVVTFGLIQIREFAQTIGDNPSVSYGTPIALDWDYQDVGAYHVEEYEFTRPPRRKLRNMMLNYYHRQNLLVHMYGYAEAEVQRAAKEASKIQHQRNITKLFLPYMDVECAVQSTVRKLKRLCVRKRKPNAKAD